MNAHLLLRLSFAVILLAGITTSGYFRKKARSAGGGISRKKESPGLIIFRLLLVIPIIVLSFMFLLDIPENGFYAMRLPIVWRFVGVLLAFAVIPLLYWVLATIGNNISETILTRDGQQLVTNGPYRRVRHPLYSSGGFLLLALAIIADSLPMLLLAILGFAAFYIIAGMEEKNLIKRFGFDYIRYSQTTGRLFPRLQSMGKNYET